MNCGFAAPAAESCPRCLGEKGRLAGSYRPPDPGRGWIRNFSAGFDYYLAGYRFISQHPRLFKYIIIPLLICLIIFLGMVVGCVYLIDPILGFLDTEWISWLDWLRTALYWVLYVLLVLLGILLSFFLTLILSSILNAPFYDFLSEKVEEIYLGRSFEEKWTWEFLYRSILFPIKESIKIALYEVGVGLVLLAISLFSAGLGTVLFALAGPYLGSLYVFDFVLARKIYTLAEKKQFLHTHLAYSMGFGVLVYLIPFLTPFAVVGATLGYMAARQK
jgi:CysZ protein